MTSDAAPGRVLGGHYRLVEELGRGAFGTVFRAVHSLDGRAFAVKVLHPAWVADARVRARFLGEGATVARFTHPNVAQVRHYGDEDGTVFLVMDLCAGRTLADLLASEGRLAPDRAARLLLPVLDALGAAHAAGIVHRDLKPSNLVIAEEPGRPATVKVLDFGLAHVAGEVRDHLSDPRTSAEAPVAGTVAYMSPEQVRGEADIDGRSDLFSLGAVLHEMVAGAPPFRGEAAFSTMLRVLEAPPEPLPLDTPGPLRLVVNTALQKNRELRFQDAAEFATALREAAGGPRSDRSPRRGLRIASAALVLSAAAAGFLLLTGDQRTAGERDRAEARNAFAAARHLEALQGFRRLAREGRALGEDHLLAGLAAVELRDPEAQADLLEAQRRLPGDPRVDRALARWAWRARDDLPAALLHLERALEHGAPPAEVRAERAVLALQGWIVRPAAADREVVARNDIEHLDRSAPGSGVALYLRAALARAEHLTGRRGEEALDEASKLLAAAEVRDPRASAIAHLGADVLERRAARRLAAGDTAAARALLQRAVDGFGRALERAESGDSLPELRIEVPSAIRLQRGHLLARLGRTDAAVDEFRAAVRALPPSLLSSAFLAAGLRAAGRLEDALPIYEQLQSLSPRAGYAKDLAYCHWLLSQRAARGSDAEAARGHARAALRRYAEARALASDDPVVGAYRAEALAWAAAVDLEHAGAHRQEAARQIDEASELLRSRTSTPEREVEVAFRLAGIRLGQGRLDEAFAAADGAVHHGSSIDPALRERRAQCRLALAARAAAREEASQAAAHLAAAEVDLEHADARRLLPMAATAWLRGSALALFADASATRAAEAVRMLRGASGSGTDEDRWIGEVASLVAEEVASPASAAREAASAQRRADLSEGRAWPSAVYWGLLAQLLDQRGDPERAALARRHAASPWAR